MAPFKYPKKIKFWDKRAHSLEYINPSDFHLKDFLRTLGLSDSPLAASFGITNRNEIIRRAEIVKFLMKNNELRKYLKQCNLFSLVIPPTSKEFLKYFFTEGQDNPFIREINSFLEAARSTQDLPRELATFCDFLSESQSISSSLEATLAEELKSELDKSTFIEGIVAFSWGTSSSNPISYDAYRSLAMGYKQYSYGQLEHKRSQVPAWTRKRRYSFLKLWPFKKFREQAIAKYAANIQRMEEEAFYAPYVVRDIPDEIVDTIRGFLKENLKEISEAIYNPQLTRAELKIGFQYSAAGLKINVQDIYGWRLYDPGQRNFEDQRLLDPSFPGYTNDEIKAIQKTNKELQESWPELRDNLLRLRILNYLQSKAGLQIETFKTIASPNVDAIYKWYDINILFGDPRFAQRVVEARRYRDYISKHLSTLQEISEVADTLIAKSHEWKLDFHFPEVLSEDTHQVAFETIMPIHLIGPLKSTDLISISSIPSINGRMIGLTGQNAGGKSVTEESIINMIFLAQSGLPVFGTKFSFNPKKTIGMVFLERGEGSTAELLLMKTKNIFEALEKTQSKDILLVIDEIGTGSAEMDGLKVGKKILKSLSRYGASVVFSTQIPELAQYAQDDLEAILLKLGMDHSISEGIGTSNLEGIMTNLGMEKYLQD